LAGGGYPVPEEKRRRRSHQRIGPFFGLLIRFVDDLKSHFLL
jgi:hypothetical protein